jgi:hypothetical protein
MGRSGSCPGSAPGTSTGAAHGTTGNSSMSAPGTGLSEPTNFIHMQSSIASIKNDQMLEHDTLLTQSPIAQNKDEAFGSFISQLPQQNFISNTSPSSPLINSSSWIGTPSAKVLQNPMAMSRSSSSTLNKAVSGPQVCAFPSDENRLNCSYECLRETRIQQDYYITSNIISVLPPINLKTSQSILCITTSCCPL